MALEWDASNHSDFLYTTRIFSYSRNILRIYECLIIELDKHDWILKHRF